MKFEQLNYKAKLKAIIDYRSMVTGVQGKRLRNYSNDLQFECNGFLFNPDGQIFDPSEY